MKPDSTMTNIHDYLERIGAKPPPVDEEELRKAKESIVWVDSIEAAVEAIVEMDKVNPPEEKP